MRCDGCPLEAGARCPAGDWPAYCRWVALERDRPEGQRYWTNKLMEEAGRPAEPEPAIDPDFPARADARGRLRVGLLAPCLISGGAETWMLALARWTDPERIVWRGAAIVGTTPVAPLALASLRALLPVAVGGAAARVLVPECDVIVSWALEDLTPIVAGRSRPQFVYVDHFPHDGPWTDAARWCIDQVDHVVAVSELCVPGVPAGFPKPHRVIWNCVEPDRLRPTRTRAEIRREWGIADDALVAGFVGRLAPEKRPEALLQAVAHLPEPWHVVLVGEGGLRAGLAATAADQHLGRAHVVGPIGPIGDALAAFDFLVSPSRLESCGLAIGEAMLAGVPVLATPVGLEKLAPGHTRRLPAEATGADIARALIADAADPAGTRDRVLRARAFARTRLAPERFGREWTEFLLQLAPTRPHSPPLAPGDAHAAQQLLHGAQQRFQGAQQVVRIPRDSVAEKVRLARLAHVCPHRSRANCGCLDPYRCALGKGDAGKVTLADCCDCLSNGGP